MAQPRRFVRFVPAAAAAVVGLLAGSTGLAFAGALPDPAQDVVHDVLEPFNVNVPEGKRGPCVSEAAKLDDKPAKQAAKDACPKGGNGADHDESSGDDGSSPATDTDSTDTDRPGRSGEAPGHNAPDASTTDTTAPGRSGEAPRPANGGQNTGQNTNVTTAPGRSGDAPGPYNGVDVNTTDSVPPGRSGEAPGPNDDGQPIVTGAGAPPVIPANASGVASGAVGGQSTERRSRSQD